MQIFQNSQTVHACLWQWHFYYLPWLLFPPNVWLQECLFNSSIIFDFYNFVSLTCNSIFISSSSSFICNLLHVRLECLNLTRSKTHLLWQHQRHSMTASINNVDGLFRNCRSVNDTCTFYLWSCQKVWTLCP